MPLPNTWTISVSLLMSVHVSCLSPLPPVALCTSESEQSRSTADNTLNLRLTSWRLVSLGGPHCGGGNLSCLQCNRQLPWILIGIMYHWLSATICGPKKIPADQNRPNIATALEFDLKYGVFPFIWVEKLRTRQTRVSVEEVCFYT